MYAHKMHILLLTILALLSATANADNCSIDIVAGEGWKTDSQSVNWYELNVTSNQKPTTTWNISIDVDATSTVPPYTASVSRSFDEYWNVLGTGFVSRADVIISSPNTNVEPEVRHISEGDTSCDITSYVNISNSGVKTESALNFVSSSDGALLGVDGQPFVMKGVNWFGFEYNGHSMVDGLSFGSSSISQDFATIVYRQQLLGFNTIRIPFNFQNLFEGALPQSWTGPCKTDSTEVVAKATTDPSVAAQSNPPAARSAAPIVSGVCNSFLPSNTIIDRYLYVVRYYAQNGFYVIIDNHLNIDPTAVNNPRLWVDYWRQLAQLIAQDSQTAPYIIMEILNEPDSYGIRWEGNNGKPAYSDILLQAMDAIQNVSPGQAMMIEGTGQLGLGINWGNGFATDSKLISTTGISDPNGFFTQLLTRQYLDAVIIAPHIYPPSVTGSTGQSGQALWTTLSQAVGYLNQVGYCVGTNCHKFPIVMTETGSFLTDPRDLNFYNDLVPYIQNTGQGVDGQHSAFAGSVWWAWNNNALDTGGLVSDDWTSILWPKIQFLETLMTLRPWYKTGALAVESASAFNPAPVQIQLLATPLRGVELAVSSLLVNDDKLYGDLLTVLQRLKLLGFNAVLLPFSFENLADTTFLKGLQRECTAANETRIKASVQPSDIPPDLLNGYTLPKVANVTEASSMCNAYIQATEPMEAFIEVINLISNSDVDVLLLNTNIQMALTAPVTWITKWTELAATLPPKIFLSPLDTTTSNIDWNSGQKVPGLSDLYITLLSALSAVNAESFFPLMGANGNDFSSSGDFFRQIFSSTTLSNITLGLAGNSSRLSTSDNTVGCSVPSCGSFPLTFRINATSPSIINQNVNLRNSSWFAQIQNPLRPRFDEIFNLQNAGLKPWFGASTAYNPAFTPGSISTVLGVEASNYDEFACYANFSTDYLSAQSPFIAVIDISFNNALYTTLQPPYAVSVNLTNGVGVQTVMHHSFTFTNGVLRAEFSEYHDILFPNQLNRQRLTSVIEFDSHRVEVDKFTVNGLECALSAL